VLRASTVAAADYATTTPAIVVTICCVPSPTIAAAETDWELRREVRQPTGGVAPNRDSRPSTIPSSRATNGALATIRPESLDLTGKQLSTVPLAPTIVRAHDRSRLRKVVANATRRRQDPIPHRAMGRAMNQTNRSTQVGEARTCNLDGPKEPTQEPMRLGYRQSDTLPVSEAGRLSVVV
jgi:hypothetical protein